MHSSLEEIYNRTQYVPGSDAIAALSSLDNALSKTASTIGQLNKSIINLSSLLSANQFQIETNNVVTVPADIVEAPPYSPNKYGKQGSMKLIPETGEALHSVEDVSELSEGLGSIAETLGKVYSKIGQLKKPLEEAGAIAKTSSATATIMNSVGGGAGIAEGIFATSELLSGGVMITELVSGPAGWAILAGTIAIGAISHYIDQEEKEKTDNQEERATKRRRKATLATFTMSSADALAYRDHEIDEIITNVQRIKNTGKTRSIDNKLQQEILKTEGRHAFEVFATPVLATADNTATVLNIRPGLICTNDDLPKPQQSYMQRTFPMLQNFISAGYDKGKPGFESAVVAATAKASMHGLHNKKETVQDVRYAAREAAQSLTASSNSEKSDQINFRVPGTKARGASGNVININMNKSLIGQFTIQCNSVDDGIKEFKHKVEEVLLEILDSANTII